MTVAAAAMLMTFVACEDEPVINSDFTIDSDAAVYNPSDNMLHFNGERTTAVISVVTGDANGRWDARCPTDDLWCSFRKDAGNLIVTVADNATDKVRDTHITIVLDGQSKTVGVRQDYIRNLSFVSAQANLGASSGTYQMGISTNVMKDNLKFSVNDSDGAAASDDFWLKLGDVSEDFFLSYSVGKNRSETETREAIVKVSGEGVESEFKVVQNMASGKPYIVPLDELNYEFEDSYVYEVWDEVNNVKIGNICREYLLKGNVDGTTVDEVAVVAYPVTKGVADHTNGYVIATIDPQTGNVTPDGGTVMWNSEISAATSGSDMLAIRMSGNLESLPGTIYIPFGGNSFTATPLDEEDTEFALNASIKPWIVTDRREGEEIEGRGTFDEFNYRVVKVGGQYWFADNLKTTRFNDGTPIPTGKDNWKSEVLVSGPVCAMAGFTSTGVSFSSADANSMTANAEAVRNETGPVYNYFALFNQKNDAENAFAGPFVDALAPSGWGVPTKDEFGILHNYVTQTSAKPESDPSLSLVMKTEHEKTATNLTGFSATSYRYRTATGTNSSNGIHYATIDTYSFSVKSSGDKDHSTIAFCCGSDMETTFRKADICWGIYVRCIKR